MGVTYPSLIANHLGPFLTSDNPFIRARACLLLTEILTRLPDLKLSNQSLLSLVEFFSERLESDYESAASCIVALRFIIEGRKAQFISLIDENGDSFFQNMIKAVLTAHHVPAMTQSYRHRVYVVVHTLVSDKDYLYLMKSFPETYNISKIVFQFLEAMEAEKDPRCLLVALAVCKLFQSELDVSLVAEFAEKMFEIIFVYFPITFRPPENDVFKISTEMMETSLNLALHGCDAMAPLVFSALFEKLSLNSSESGVNHTKTEALKTLTGCLTNFSISVVPSYMADFRALLKDLVISPDDPELAFHGLKLCSTISQKIASEIVKALDTSAAGVSFEKLILEKGEFNKQVGDLLTSCWTNFVIESCSECKQELERKFESMNSRGCMQILASIAGSSDLGFFQVFLTFWPMVRGEIATIDNKSNESTSEDQFWCRVVAFEFLHMLLLSLKERQAFVSHEQTDPLLLAIKSVFPILLQELQLETQLFENCNDQGLRNLLLCKISAFKSMRIIATATLKYSSPSRYCNHLNVYQVIIALTKVILTFSTDEHVQKTLLSDMNTLGDNFVSFIEELLLVESADASPVSVSVIEDEKKVSVLVETNIFPKLLQHLESSVCLSAAIKLAKNTTNFSSLLNRILSILIKEATNEQSFQFILSIDQDKMDKRLKAFSALETLILAQNETMNVENLGVCIKNNLLGRFLQSIDEISDEEFINFGLASLKHQLVDIFLTVCRVDIKVRKVHIQYFKDLSLVALNILEKVFTTCHNSLGNEASLKKIEVLLPLLGLVIGNISDLEQFFDEETIKRTSIMWGWFALQVKWKLDFFSRDISRRVLGSLVNKCTVFLLGQTLLKSAVESLLDGQKISLPALQTLCSGDAGNSTQQLDRVEAVLLVGFVVKALVMRGEIKSTDVIFEIRETITANEMETNELVMATASIFCDLVKPCILMMNKNSGCKVSFLYQQKAIKTLYPKLKSFDEKPSRTSVLNRLCLSLFMESVPQKSMSEIKSDIFPVVLQSFSVAGERLSLKEFTGKKALIFSFDDPILKLKVSALNLLFSICNADDLTLTSGEDILGQLRSEICKHLKILISNLLLLSFSCEKQRERAKALDLLCFIGENITFHDLFPFRKDVARGLKASLDDSKKSVRKKATFTRNLFLTLESNVK